MPNNGSCMWPVDARFAAISQCPYPSSNGSGRRAARSSNREAPPKSARAGQAACSLVSARRPRRRSVNTSRKSTALSAATIRNPTANIEAYAAIISWPRVAAMGTS
ncbi:MAG TPA: hypothetical protein VKE27_05615, partial [Candidatus Dormibacteraeota bacterium]|nr:hypothetical protein [Candidatus Dormibacteraeota bacterium]